MNPSFSPWQQVRIFGISSLGWATLWMLGSTLRYQVEDWANLEQVKEGKRPVILSFWHNQVLYATHFWRFRSIAVVTSRHFDGECIGRVIQKFGYIPARGSSGKGGVRVLLELKKYMDQGLDTAFTVDGPQGPRYRVKSGPLWLARQTGAPVVPFHMQPFRYWTLSTWDAFRIPKPYTSVLLKIGKPFFIPPEASEEEWIEHYQSEMDRLSEYGESYWKE